MQVTVDGRVCSLARAAHLDFVEVGLARAGRRTLAAGQHRILQHGRLRLVAVHSDFDGATLVGPLDAIGGRSRLLDLRGRFLRCRCHRRRGLLLIAFIATSIICVLAVVRIVIIIILDVVVGIKLVECAHGIEELIELKDTITVGVELGEELVRVIVVECHARGLPFEDLPKLLLREGARVVLVEGVEGLFERGFHGRPQAQKEAPESRNAPPRTDDARSRAAEAGLAGSDATSRCRGVARRPNCKRLHFDEFEPSRLTCLRLLRG